MFLALFLIILGISSVKYAWSVHISEGGVSWFERLFGFVFLLLGIILFFASLHLNIDMVTFIPFIVYIFLFIVASKKVKKNNSKAKKIYQNFLDSFQVK